MSYEFYLDVYFIENLVINYALLRMTNKLLRCSATRVRSLLSAAACSGAAVMGLVLLYRYNMLSTTLVSVAANTIMVRFGCKIKEGRRLVQGMLFFYMGTACMGLAFSWLRRLTGTAGVRAFCLTAAVSYLLIYILMKVYDQVRLWEQRYCRVTLCQDGNVKRVKGLYDTGNMLWDTTLQSYVSVIDISLIKELLSEEAGRELEEFCAQRVPESPELLSALRPHYIPYQCVGCEGGLLPVVVLDYLCLEQGDVQKLVTHPVIAIDKTCSSSLRSYQMILNPNLIDS